MCPTFHFNSFFKFTYSEGGGLEDVSKGTGLQGEIHGRVGCQRTVIGIYVLWIIEGLVLILHKGCLPLWHLCVVEGLLQNVACCPQASS